MYVLGIKPSLGKNTWFSDMWGHHNPGACLLDDGEIVAVAEEERFNRQKYSIDTFPEESTAYVLDEAGIELDDVDTIAIGRDPKLRARALWTDWRYRVPTSLRRAYRLFSDVETVLAAYAGAHVEITRNHLCGRFGDDWDCEFTTVNHHRCHAASAYYCAPADDPAVVTVDGQGEHDSTVLWDADLNRVREFSARNSIGYFYSIGTNYLGYRYSTDAGKVMGLASYGDYRPEFEDAFEELTTIGDGGYDVTQVVGADDPQAVLESHFGAGLDEPEGFSQRHEDFAFHLQRRTEEILEHVVESHVEATGVRDVALAGGVAMNCRANRAVAELDAVDSLFVQPAANDAGIPLGAALEAYAERTGDVPDATLSHVYYGPSYTNQEIEAALEGSKVAYERVDDVSRRVAEHLADGDLVGWFQGRMEFGARALGNRSILANPTERASLDRVNRDVKHREPWRPFAPSLLYEAREEWLEHGDEAPFMILLDSVSDAKRDDVEAIVHVDGTTRPQTVRKEVNERYYRVIEEFEALTGVPVVLNTSFNTSGEPIVESPRQAIADFATTGLDVLAIGDFVLEKAAGATPLGEPVTDRTSPTVQPEGNR